MKKIAIIILAVSAISSAFAYNSHYDVRRGENLVVNCESYDARLDVVNYGDSVEVRCIEPRRRPNPRRVEPRRPAPRRDYQAPRCEVVRNGNTFELRAGAEVLATTQVRSSGGLLGGLTGRITAALRAKVEASLKVSAFIESGRCSEVNW